MYCNCRVEGTWLLPVDWSRCLHVRHLMVDGVGVGQGRSGETVPVPVLHVVRPRVGGLIKNGNEIA